MDKPKVDRSEVAKERLLAMCHTKQRARIWVWSTQLLASVLGGLFLVALLDYWLIFPTLLRFIGFFLLAASAVAGLWQLLQMLGRRTSLKEVALDVEAQRPRVGCTISTAAEYIS